jgi:dipeptidyl aminopeptidase/acylaminoacyl peptidase
MTGNIFPFVPDFQSRSFAMNQVRRIISSLTLLAVIALSFPALGANKRVMTEMDLFKFTWIGDPQISPDGSRVVFVRVSVNQKADRYDTALWIVPTGGGPPRPLTAGPRDSSPRFSPDGRRLAFTRSAEREGRPQPQQIYLMTFDGGEAQPLTEMARGAGGIDWSPDGKTLLFSSSEESSAEEVHAEGEMKGKDPERKSDVRVITRAVYRSNGAGYLNPKSHSHLWTVSVPDAPGPAPKPRQITKGRFDEGNASWSADGSRIYFISNRVLEPYYEEPRSDLYSIAPDGTDEKKVLSFDGGMRGYTFSPDGRRIAFGGVAAHKPVLSYTQPDLFVVNNEPNATPRNLTVSYDFDIGGGLAGDQRAPRGGGGGGGVVWSRDGRSLYVNVAEHGRANLKRIDSATGKVEPLTAGDHEVQAYTATADASRMALLISSSVNTGDLFLLDTDSGRMTQLTRINEELFSQINLTHPEEIWYTSFDGKKIQAWIQKPPDFDSGKKYPFILQIHGGPHAAYGFTFTHEFQWMAAKGYVVLYTNPRGSTSYGQEFGNIIQHNYPGDDYKDLMAGVDEVIKRGYIDTNKLGVTGGSGGGVLTNWTVGHTTRFRAAVSQRSIADWAGFWYTADFTLFTPTWFRAAPWEDPADFVKRSPITYIKNVTTPMMFIEGEADWRTPANEGGEVMFRALKYRRIPTVMVRFPNESHDLSRSGAPWHRIERLQHILRWFDKYLQDKPIKIYDVE